MAGTRNNEFLRLIERTEDAFANSDDPAVEDVRRILTDVRTQYDHVHMEAEKKETELQHLREAIRVADQSHSARDTESTKQDDHRTGLEKQYSETTKSITEAMTARKVYKHMLDRITKEQAILREKMLCMDQHLERKSAECHRKASVQERLVRKGAQSAQELDALEQDIEQERVVRDEAHKANEAFNASAGRLRKLYAVEKLAGNCLQKITFEQVERSQHTEEGFQRIREVTGLTDVMDIVHKFLNRDVEHEQLKSSVKESEVRLEALREQFDHFKKDTDGLTFDPDTSSHNRAIYLEVDEHESKLNQTLKEHEQSRQRLQASTLQVEHMKRWANRIGKSLAMFEDCRKVDKPSDLIPFFQEMQKAVDKFIAHIVQQISAGKVQRKNMSQVASKEYHEASRLLTDRDFLRANCRIPASLDAGRPSSRQGQSVTEDDSVEAHQADRERCKQESKERTEKAEHLRKKKNIAN
eukprot:CAMPEP_0169376730 /NCGR_PEP_ID=MMETSP1017-20121227/38829_1 /TAXON_ID=342587 /ORGANISM="Karlodinium micrum, Strain CCMP2283" /LENGTH=469 /DNA_ID=CAMNT_0009475799 /DNA_START=122 /DNA_END=1531 /DNA_ORIENTATION=+